jgi:hypothetical protein
LGALPFISVGDIYDAMVSYDVFPGHNISSVREILSRCIYLARQKQNVTYGQRKGKQHENIGLSVGTTDPH